MVFIVPKLGKIRSLQAGALAAGLLAGGCFFVQRDQALLLAFLVPFLGATTSGPFLAICAMQPDSCGACMMRLNKRNEGMLYSVFLFGGKAGSGIALGLSSVALGVAGFEGSQGEDIEQSDAVLLTMRVLLFVIPTVAVTILLIISLFIKDYKLEFGTIRHETIYPSVHPSMHSVHHASVHPSVHE